MLGYIIKKTLYIIRLVKYLIYLVDLILIIKYNNL